MSNQDFKKTKEKTYKLYIDFDIIEAYEELFKLLEDLKPDLYKSLIKGSKTSGVRTRNGLKAAKELLGEILKNSLPAERAAKAAQPRHGNSLDPIGAKKMLEKRNIKLKDER